MRKPLLTLILLTTSIVSKAQNGYTPAVSTLTFAGTANQTAMLVDQAGHKWLGIKSTLAAEGGLVYFDGINWTIYNMYTTPSLPDNLVQCLARDNSGNVWIGTPAGLVKWNSGNFTTYTTVNGLPSNDIKSLAASGNMLYIGTYKGLSRFDGSSFTNYNLTNGGLATDTVNALDAENAGTIWIGAYNRLVKFSINATYTVFSSQSFAIPGTGFTNSIYHDAQGMKWIGTSSVTGLSVYSKGVLAFNGTTFTKADSVYTIYGSVIPGKVIDICEGPHGGVAFRGQAGSNGCVIELGASGKVYQYFRNEPAYTLWRIGEFVEKDGPNLVISYNGFLTPYDNTMRVMYYDFDPTNYSSFNLGNTVNNGNFKTLDINEVSAGIGNRGDMHCDGGGNNRPLYVVPKVNDRRLERSSSFASGLWMSGYDGGGLLHTSAETYRQNGSDYWPGPLDTTFPSVSNAVASAYDKIWKVSYTDINDFVTNFNTGNVQNGSFKPAEDILTWPAQGTGNLSRNLAPFVDLNHNGVYDPLVGGDYPKIKGDQALYFIFNDAGPHDQTNCNAFGFEVQGMAYAYGCPNVVQGRPELQYTTFYDYKIINRAQNAYNNVNVALWSDADLGFYDDDYIGSNVHDNYGYVYNGDGYDENSGNINGYGNYPPAQGYAFMQGPLADPSDGIDNDNDGFVDEPGEQCLMNHFMFYNNVPASASTTDPSGCAQFNGYLNGHWKDGTPLTCGGNGYGGSIAANFAYPDNTDLSGNCAGWTEITAGNQPGDRRIILSAGPFTIAAGETRELEYALVTSFDSTAANAPFNSVTKLQSDIQKVRNFYALANKPNCLVGAVTGIEEQGYTMQLTVYPNPVGSLLNVKLADDQKEKLQYELTDMLGKTVMAGVPQSITSFSIPVAELKSGIYFLKVRTGRNIAVRKIVKE